MFFFFNDTATTEIYTLSLHDALPIFFVSKPRRSRISVVAAGRDRTPPAQCSANCVDHFRYAGLRPALRPQADRKSTRLNSSHLVISYAVFCLKKKKHSAWRLIVLYSC